LYIKTVLFSSSFSDEGITYFVPDFLEEKIKIGQIILVPYWKQIKDAVILEILDKIDFDEKKIKSIIEIKFEIPLLFPYQIKLINFIAKKYFSLIHHCLNLFFPKNLKEKIRKDKITPPIPNPFPPREKGDKSWDNLEYSSFLRSTPKYIINLARDFRKKPTKYEDFMWNILRRNQLNWIKFRRQHPFWRYIADFYSDELKLVIELDWKIHEETKEYDKIRDEFIKQYKVRIIRIKNQELEKDLKLVIQKILSPVGGKYPKGDRGIHLSQKQQETYEKIINSKNDKILFHWITWSWKTEIYMKIIEKNLKENKQTLVLVPEIILNSQIFERIEKIFPENIVLINSTISEAKKTKIRLDIYTQKSKIIVWTRSALFYPYKNLWTIIVDEEHDNSYYSDKNPRYSWVEVALKISELLKIKVILASGTPKINDMYKAIKWEFELISLMEKFVSKKL